MRSQIEPAEPPGKDLISEGTAWHMVPDRGRHRGRPFHQHEPRPLQMPHKPLGRDPGHCIVRVVNALPAVVAEREGQGFGDLIWGSGTEVGRVGHGWTIGEVMEHNKKPNAARRHDPPGLGRKHAAAWPRATIPSGKGPGPFSFEKPQRNA
jgi:hypothetical protein